MATIDCYNGSFIIDDEDVPTVTKWKWHINQNGYVVRQVYAGGGRKNRKFKVVRLHRYLMSPECRYDVDHINGDRKDNRRANLRVCSRSENLMNSKIRSDSTSGYRGVSFSKNTQKWHAYVNAGGKRFSAGLFKSIEEAVEARDALATRVHGEFFRPSWSASQVVK